MVDDFATHSVVVGTALEYKPPPAISTKGSPRLIPFANSVASPIADVDASAGGRRGHRGAVDERHDLYAQAGFVEQAEVERVVAFGVRVGRSTADPHLASAGPGPGPAAKRASDRPLRGRVP